MGRRLQKYYLEQIHAFFALFVNNGQPSNRIGGGVPPGSPNPDPISDQKM